MLPLHAQRVIKEIMYDAVAQNMMKAQLKKSHATRFKKMGISIGTIM